MYVPADLALHSTQNGVIVAKGEMLLNVGYVFCCFSDFNINEQNFGNHSVCSHRQCLFLLLDPLPNDKFLNCSKLKDYAEDSFQFDENGRRLSKWVENNRGKGRISRYEQFLLFPKCFQKTRAADT